MTDNHGDRRRMLLERIRKAHEKDHPDRPLLVAEVHPCHFADPAFTTLIVAPLSTLIGTWLPGLVTPGEGETTAAGLGALLDRIAEGAAVHVVPAAGDFVPAAADPVEVLATFFDRLRFWEREKGLVTAGLSADRPLRECTLWGHEQAGVPFVDPGAIAGYDIDLELNSFAEHSPQFAGDIEAVLDGADALEIDTRLALVRHASRSADAPVPTLGIDPVRWADILQQGVARVLRTDDDAQVVRALDFVHAMAFFDSVRDRLLDLGLDNLGKVREAQEALAVPAEGAEAFYRDRVDGAVRRLAFDFHAARGRLAERLGER